MAQPVAKLFECHMEPLILPFKYNWNIHNFEVEYEMIDCKKRHLESSPFTFGPNDEVSLSLCFYPKGYSGQEDCCEFEIRVIDIDVLLDEVWISYNCGVLTARGYLGRYRGIKLTRIPPGTTEIQSGRPGTWFRTNLLMSDRTFYLPGGTLTLCAEGAVKSPAKLCAPPLEHITRNMPHSTDDITSRMKRLLDEGKFFDLSLRVEERVFRCHKAVLASRSAVFEAMFTCDMKEKQFNEVVITDFDEHVMEAFLHFLYTDESSFDALMAERLLPAAEKYQIDALKEICVVKLIQNLNSDNILCMIVLGDKYNSPTLKSAATNAAVAAAKELVKSSSWQYYKENAPHVISEIFEAIFHS